MKRSERAAVEELAQLLDGELATEDASASVRRLSVLATTVSATETVPAPTAAFRAACRTELTDAIATVPTGPATRLRDAAWSRTAGLRHSARVAVASTVASGLLGSAGVAVAAQHALPGELLYGVKRGTESVRLALASGLVEEGGVHLALAEERLEELRTAAPRLDTDAAIDLLDRMDAASVAGAGALLQAVTDGGDRALLQTLTAWSERQRTGLAAVYDDLPAQARPFADGSFEVLRRIEVQIEVLLAPCAACGGDQAAAVRRTTPVPDRPLLARPGEGPTRPSSPPCDCVGPGRPAPPTTRDPGVTAPTTSPAPEPRPEPSEPPAPAPAPEDEHDLVPPLPEPLDPVGDAVDDAVGDVVDTVGDLPLPSTSPAPAPSAGDVDDVGVLLDPLAP